jgi:chaperonin GroEL
LRRPPAPPKPKEYTPYVYLDDKAAKALYRGFDEMAELLALTLGPTKGAVLSERYRSDPEILEDAATMARRILALRDRAENVGAMLVRNLAWRVHMRTGDGSATATVLARAVLREAMRYIAAGGNAMVVRDGIAQGLRIADATLAEQAQPVVGEEAITRVAESLTGEPRLSVVLGEMFDVLGPQAHITVENYVAPYLERVYYSGGRWSAQLQSPYLLTDQVGKRAVQEDCDVVVYQGRVKTVEDVEPLVQLLGQRAEKKPLLIICQEVSGDALSVLVSAHHRSDLKMILTGLRRVGDSQRNDFTDLALLTGATLIGWEQGTTLADLTLDGLGSVKRAEATATDLILSGSGGDPAAIRARIEQLHTYLGKLREQGEDRNEILLRLGRLSGGVGVLKIGAYSKIERDLLNQKAGKAISSLRVAMSEGMAPGGGVAFVWAADAVRSAAEGMEGDRKQGMRILATALEEPFLQIVKNSGMAHPKTVLADLHRFGAEYVYDALTGRLATLEATGLWDPAGVLRQALDAGVSGGMMALTVSALVLHRKPQESLEP